MAEVRLRDVSRVHDDGTRALSHIDLAVADGQRLAVVGPSGSGKSTLLRVVAGLERADHGHVELDGTVVDHVAPRDRDVAFVFQSAALYTHLDVAGNLGFPLRVRGTSRDEVARRVGAEAGVLGLRRLLRRSPRTLSAGHRQAVALGRATTRVPRVLCLDEPLSQLDAHERTRLRREVVSLQTGLGVTLLHATNDRTEAFAIGERVAVLRRGRVEQVDEPSVLYDAPASPFVAAFVADAALVAGSVERHRDAWWLILGAHRLRFAGVPPCGPLPDGTRVVVALRPDQLVTGDRAGPYPADRRLTARVARVEHLGDTVQAIVQLDATPVALGDEPSAHTPSAHTSARARVRTRIPANSGVRRGDLLELAVDLRGARLYDLATGCLLGA